MSINAGMFFSHQPQRSLTHALWMVQLRRGRALQPARLRLQETHGSARWVGKGTKFTCLGCRKVQIVPYPPGHTLWITPFRCFQAHSPFAYLKKRLKKSPRLSRERLHARFSHSGQPRKRAAVDIAGLRTGVGRELKARILEQPPSGLNEYANSATQ